MRGLSVAMALALSAGGSLWSLPSAAAFVAPMLSPCRGQPHPPGACAARPPALLRGLGQPHRAPARGSSKSPLRIQMNGRPPYIKIGMGKGKKEQMLPMSMVDHFPVWLFQDSELRQIYNNDDPPKGGWVDPISWGELWLPEDLPLPVMRPAVAAIVRDGVIRYLMPGLDISIQAGGKLWWNRGMCSFPLAAKWADVAACDLARLRLAAYAQSGYRQAEKSTIMMKDEGEPQEEDEPTAWEKVWQAPASEAITSLVMLLADEAGKDIGHGFHIVVVPAEGEDLRQAPDAGTRLKVLLTDSPLEPLTQGLEEEEDFDHAGAEMDILCRRVVAGGSSQYLPEVYKELYGVE